MTPIERNDVDIRPLLNWSKAFELIDGENVIDTVYMRLVGDADLNRSRVAALRRSADLRKRLKNLDSDERVAYIADIDDLSEENLTNLIVVFSMRSLSIEASKKAKVQVPKAPRSDASTEAFEKYQEELDSYASKRNEEVKRILNREINKLKKSLEAADKKNLYDQYIRLAINELCEQELIAAFKENAAYYGAFRDPELKERYFSSFEEFSNLESALKAQFLSAYADIELQGEELKKLRQATP